MPQSRHSVINTNIAITITAHQKLNKRCIQQILLNQYPQWPYTKHSTWHPADLMVFTVVPERNTICCMPPEQDEPINTMPTCAALAFQQTYMGHIQTQSLGGKSYTGLVAHTQRRQEDHMAHSTTLAEEDCNDTDVHSLSRRY